MTKQRSSYVSIQGANKDGGRWAQAAVWKQDPILFFAPRPSNNLLQTERTSVCIVSKGVPEITELKTKKKNLYCD